MICKLNSLDVLRCLLYSNDETVRLMAKQTTANHARSILITKKINSGKSRAQIEILKGIFGEAKSHLCWERWTFIFVAHWIFTPFSNSSQLHVNSWQKSPPPNHFRSVEEKFLFLANSNRSKFRMKTGFF